MSDDAEVNGDSWVYMKRLEKRDSRIHVYRNSGPGGQVGNTNNALNYSTGEWIKFLHDDDVLKPECLSELVHIAEKYGKQYNIASITCGLERHFQDRQLWKRRVGWPQLELIPRDQIHIAMYMAEDAGGAAPSQKMIHRRVLDERIRMEQPAGLHMLVDSWFNALIGKVGDLLIYRKPLVEWHQGEHATETSRLESDSDEELFLLRDMFYDLAKDKKSLPSPKVMKQMVALQRGGWRLSRGQLLSGFQLLMKVRDPRAVVEYGRWIKHNIYKGKYARAKRIVLDNPSRQNQNGRSDLSKTVKVSFYVFFPGGGIGRYTNELAAELNRLRNISVEVMCTEDFEWVESKDYNIWSGLKSISHNFAILRKSLFLLGQFINPYRAIMHAKKTGKHVIHFSNINHLSFPFWKKLIDKTDIKVIVSAHDVRRQKRILSRYWENRQLKAFYRFADALFVHSEYQANELCDFAGIRRTNIHVVPHGPYSYPDAAISKSDLKKKWNIPRNKQVALFFGQIRDEKNLDGFLKAFLEVNNKIYLIIAGSSGSKHKNIDYYRNIIHDLGLSKDVLLIPRYIDDNEVAELFTISDWVALPYIASFTSQSGVLNVAAYYNKPLLVTPAPVLKETILHSGIGVISKGYGTQDLIEAINEMYLKITNKHYFDFQKYKTQYSWKENIRKTVKVYRQLVHS